MCQYQMLLAIAIHCVYTVCCQQIDQVGSMLNPSEDSGFSLFTQERCYRLCVYASGCASFDWNRETRVCRLHSNSTERKKNTSSTFLADNKAVKVGPCMKRPCSSGHVCVPVSSSTEFRCLKTGDNSPSTTEEATSDACTSASNCTGNRRCSIGHGFDVQNQLCRKMKECLQYENTFEMYPDRYIYGNNVVVLGTEDCKAECLAHDCLTYDINGNTCYIQMVFWHDVNGWSRKKDKESKHFQRNCRTWRQL